MRRHVLVMCTGNSARSQIAEAYLRKLAGDRLDVSSAGTEPAAEIHPMARAVLIEDGLRIEGQRPKHFRDFLGKEAVDTLIVVCDGAAEACPSAWPGVLERLVWPFDDPAALQGDEEERLEGFRRVRDQIREKISEWVATL